MGIRGHQLLYERSKTVSGVILSNTCDLSPENIESRPVNILFAPLIKLSAYDELLRNREISEEQRRDTLETIRNQRVTYLFYCPAYGTVLDESMVLLDDIHAHPAKHFIENERRAVFTLNQYGFYLFLLKLSIHFSRFQEGIKRGS